MAAEEKILSLFEAHTDLIVKGARDTQYGHKLNLSSGKSGRILDVVIESGNPADAERLLAIWRLYGAASRQVAADGGYASRANVQAAKAREIINVAFHKKRGLSIDAMVNSPWVYRKLRNFGAGIEAGISCLKRPMDWSGAPGRGGRIPARTSGHRWLRTTLRCLRNSNPRSRRYLAKT